VEDRGIRIVVGCLVVFKTGLKLSIWSMCVCCRVASSFHELNVDILF
jgi:hypothetical protein